MKKYLEKWGVVTLLLVTLFVLNVAPVLARNIQNMVATASLAPGEPAQTELYVGNAVSSPVPTSSGCCFSSNGGGTSSAAQPSCH